MSEMPSDRVVIRRAPWFWMVCALVSVAVGVVYALQHPGSESGAVGAIVLGIIVFYMTLEINTCVLDPRARTVTLTRWRPHGRKVRQIAFHEIAAVGMDEAQMDETGASLQVVFALSSGEKVPLTSYHAGGLRSTRRLARRLERLIGCGPAA